MYRTACVRELKPRETPSQCSYEDCEPGYVPNGGQLSVCVPCEARCENGPVSAPCFNTDGGYCGGVKFFTKEGGVRFCRAGLVDCDYIKYEAGLTPLSYECLAQCDRDTEYYVEYSTTEDVDGVSMPKTNCTTPEYCATTLGGKVFDNTTCRGNTRECVVYQAKTPSTMAWFCNTECKYEVVANASKQIKVCSDCKDMWLVPHKGEQTECVASCFKSYQKYRGEDTQCVDGCPKFVEEITSVYKGYEISDRQCVERCSTGLVSAADKKQCLKRCAPPLVGFPMDDQFLCVEACGDGFAVDKSDPDFWKCDASCDFITQAGDEECVP